MGRAKEEYMERILRGFTEEENVFVCEDHFQDSSIISFIRKHGNKDEKCFFCSNIIFEEEEFTPTYSISTKVLLEGLIKCINRSYDDPANGLAYESAEGGYIGGDTYTTLDLLNNVIPLEADYKVIEYIAENIYQDSWTEADFYGTRHSEELIIHWKSFSNLIKTKVRYMFNDVKPTSDFPNPLNILNVIGDCICKLSLFVNFPDETELFPKSNVIYRARQHEDSNEVKLYKDICSPPNTKATANRFSAEGISMFYGAADESTAVEEVINRKKTDEYLTISEFYPTRKLLLIDLRNIKRIGFFDFEKVDLYEPSQFLERFVDKVSEKLSPEDSRGIEFAPYQVVTEFFKHVLSSKLEKPIDGIIYKSAQKKDSDCYVIFAEHDNCSDEENIKNETLLVLKKNSLRTRKVSSL